MNPTPIPKPLAVAGAALLLAAGALLAGCGQQGPLYIPDTPAAAQRATLPQTLFGGGKARGPDADAAQKRESTEDDAPLPPDRDDVP